MQEVLAAPTGKCRLKLFSGFCHAKLKRITMGGQLIHPINICAPKKGGQAMHAKLSFSLCLMILVTAMSPLLMDYADSQAMGTGGRHRGMGPMMGGGRNLGENPVEPTANSIDNGRALFQTHCVVCHGPRGRGDGPAAAGLNPRPADLMLSARMLRDGVVAGVITDGRGAMPSFKATLDQTQIWDLTNFVKSLAR